MDEVQAASDFSKFANVAAVPVVIAITGIIKKNFTFKHKSNLIAVLVSLVVCTGWALYGLTPEEIGVVQGGGIHAWFRYGIDLLIASAATWFAASKGYDLVRGDKKREQVLVGHRDEIVKLEKKVRGEDETSEEDSEISKKLRSILEG